MAKVVFKGMCNGTLEKVSQRTGKPYKITQFVEVTDAGMKQFDLFGDLGLPRDLTVREYVIEGTVTGISFPKLVTGGVPGSAGQKS